MAELYEQLKPKSKYYDRANFQSQDDYDKALENTSTVYVGNLSFYTSQDSIYELFARCGEILDIKMGINNQGNPCGFCFVIFHTHEDARKAVQYISHTKLWQRIIRVDWDPGYKEGREKGRGSGGHQKRDDYRNFEDADRPIKNPTKKVHTERDYRDNRNYRDNYNRDNRGQNRDYNNNNNNRDYNNHRGDYRDNRDYRKPKVQKPAEQIENDF